ncbi:MAG TPA: hypothetical protein VJP02_18910 [Candidatus Sulfotelmatobacter sp.]|nr:hypothetical protein [Candidatus Sulfotelmatobacter sp.]
MRSINFTKTTMLVVCALGLMVLAGFGEAWAECDNSTIRGAYTTAFTALVGGPGDPNIGDYLPVARIGALTFTPDPGSRTTGTLSGADTISIAGFLKPLNYTGTYEVHSDCTGFAILNAFTSATDLQLVILDHGKQIDWIRADDGLVTAGNFRAQNVECGNSIVDGKYAYAYDYGLSTAHANVFSGLSAFAPGAASGSLTFRPDGSLSGVDVVSEEGAIRPRVFTGTYSLNSDCTGTMELDEVVAGGGGAALHANVVISAGGKEIDFLQTDAGTVVAFTLKKAGRGEGEGR